MKWQPTQPPYEPPRGSPPARPIHPRASPPPMPHHQHHRRETPHYAPMFHHGFGQPRHVPPPPGPGHFDARYYNHHRNPSYPHQILPPPHLSQYGSPAAHPRMLIEESPNSRTSPPRDPNASPTTDQFRAAGCTCKKSRCLKLYCQCFALSSTCGPKCKCQTCHNTPLHAEDIEEARKTILDRNPSAFDDKFRGSPASSPYRPGYAMHTTPWQPAYTAHVSGPAHAVAAQLAQPPTQRVNKFGCKCRRSFCLKKYCECFQNDVHCGLHCRCSNCKNNPADPGQPHNEDTPAVPAGLSARAVSSETAMASASNVEEESAEDSEDRMAIMAAVAMTQLRPRRVSVGTSKGGEAEPTTRKAELVSASPDSSADESSAGPAKRPKLAPDETSPERSTMETRNPSPVSVMTPHSYLQPHHHHHLPHHHHHPHIPHMHHHLARHHHPPNPFPFYPSPPPRASPTYEDVIKSSGLPKSLSFRKICSKCGKTRGEHGELGFGNKCVYQDCGKCGAGIQMHLKAGSPMGILCRLTVEEGATPGSSAIYKRKIRDLAARAELQKSLQEDKRERAERLAQTLP